MYPSHSPEGLLFGYWDFALGWESSTRQTYPVRDFTSGKSTGEDMFKRIAEEQATERALMVSIACHQYIVPLLREMSLHPKELRKLRILQATHTPEDRTKVELVYKLEKLRELLLHSTLPDLSLDILSNPDELSRLIDFRKQGLRPDEINRRFRRVM